MKKVNQNEFDEIELLEKQLSRKLVAYKDFKNSENNERYFNNLHYNTMSTKDEKMSNPIFSYNPAISYVMLFIISFAVSYQLIDFSNEVSLNNELYLFSETSFWFEEEDYLSGILDDDFDLDYASFISSELNYPSNLTLSDEMDKLSENELNEIYENLKNKKIL